MGTFRSRGRWFASLALLALAIQFVASFGHVHLREFAGATQARAAALSPDAPVGPGSDRDEDRCDICATLHALGSAAIASPPALPLPLTRATGQAFIVGDIARALIRCASFRSRAPPVC